ncbi:hypothetical protein SEA_MILDRED21_29 [Streptomyces phage Mildred21]|uniref:Uncharacterized protein n=1 Tax=Streptomyces phage Mildred21 TaxID=2023959 RepID=A0A222YV87_9CAUD|nr:hypothetical protein FDI35_gp029 [Streptomyces phage Mildred21]ASR75437.1 hypothetical protein SEA_MILDRED21_29 [Streptomyces phage Mildred21]
MSDVSKALNSLREKRRNAARGYDRAKAAGDRIGMQRCKREIVRLDGEIENLEN